MNIHILTLVLSPIQVGAQGTAGGGNGAGGGGSEVSSVSAFSAVSSDGWRERKEELVRWPLQGYCF